MWIIYQQCIPRSLSKRSDRLWEMVWFNLYIVVAPEMVSCWKGNDVKELAFSGIFKGNIRVWLSRCFTWGLQAHRKPIHGRFEIVYSSFYVLFFCHMNLFIFCLYASINMFAFRLREVFLNLMCPMNLEFSWSLEPVRVWYIPFWQKESKTKNNPV